MNTAAHISPKNISVPPSDIAAISHPRHMQETTTPMPRGIYHWSIGGRIPFSPLFLLRQSGSTVQKSVVTTVGYTSPSHSIVGRVSSRLTLRLNSVCCLTSAGIMPVIRISRFHVPLASILLAVELFGAADLSYFAFACGISYMLSGYFGLYSSQKIMYSKLKAEFINIQAK